MVKTEVVREKNHWSCAYKGFPTFGIILLVVGIIWLFNDLGVWNINIPWVPLILIVIALSIISNKFIKK